MKKSELMAKSSNIHDIIMEFNGSLRRFDDEVGKKLSEIADIAEAVQWSGNEAEEFKKKVRESTEALRTSLSKTKDIEDKLDKKAAEWAAILEKLKRM